MPYASRKKQLAAQRRAYRADKGAYLWRQSERRQRARDFIWSIKAKSPCVKCGNDNPIVIEFHHRDRAQKEITASHMVQNKYSNERILAELRKCDPVCANCHRIIHHED
jgi:hypothetical protein